MGVGDSANSHPMDEDIMMIHGAALNSVSNDDSEKIMKQRPADELYSVPILQVARSDESSVDGYSLGGGLYGQSTVNAHVPTITLLPSLSSPPPPPPPTGPSWMQPQLLSTPHQQQQERQYGNDDGSEYTSDSESQFVHDKSVSNNKTTLTTTPTLLPRTLSVDSGDDDDSDVLSLPDHPLTNNSTRVGEVGATNRVSPANNDQNSALRVRSVYSADFDEANSSAEQPNDSTIDDDDLLRQAAFSPRLAGAGAKDDALGFQLMGTPATALLTPSPNVSRITKGFDGRSDEDNYNDDTYDYDDIVLDAAPWDESTDELELSGGGNDLAAQLESLKREADEMLAVPVAGLPRDGDQLLVPPSMRDASTPQQAAHRTPGSVRRRGKPYTYGSA